MGRLAAAVAGALATQAGASASFETVAEGCVDSTTRAADRVALLSAEGWRAESFGEDHLPWWRDVNFVEAFAVAGPGGGVTSPADIQKGNRGGLETGRFSTVQVLTTPGAVVFVADASEQWTSCVYAEEAPERPNEVIAFVEGRFGHVRLEDESGLTTLRAISGDTTLVLHRIAAALVRTHPPAPMDADGKVQHLAASLSGAGRTVRRGSAAGTMAQGAPGA
jgi:hypothetical protein